MFEQVLPGKTKAVLAILEKSEIIQKAYLAGGTALALQLGHRMSYDLDFFTQEEFNEQMLLPEIEKISNFQLEKIAWRTILGKIHILKSLIYFNDADSDETPKMLKTTGWEDIKKYFEKEIKKLAR